MPSGALLWEELPIGAFLKISGQHPGVVKCGLLQNIRSAPGCQIGECPLSPMSLGSGRVWVVSHVLLVGLQHAAALLPTLAAFSIQPFSRRFVLGVSPLVFTKTKSTQSHKHAGMLGGPARTAQAQGSGGGSPRDTTDCYGGAYPFPDLKFCRGADPMFSAAPCELQRLLLVQASRTIVAHSDNMLHLESVQSDASSGIRGTYLCSPDLTTDLDFGEWFAHLGLRSLVVHTPRVLQLHHPGMSPTIRMDLVIDPEAVVRHFFHHRHDAMSWLLSQHACSAGDEAVEAHSVPATGPRVREQVPQGLPEDANPTP